MQKMIHYLVEVVLYIFTSVGTTRDQGIVRLVVVVVVVMAFV